MQLKNLIRDVPDFPKKGIIFKDITPLLLNGAAIREAVDKISSFFSKKKIDAVCGIEARGFILGSAVAYKLSTGFIPIRKPGKLPSECAKQSYDLEYGTDAIEMHKDSVTSGKHILMIDDLLATGGTMRAAAELVTRLGGHVVGIGFLVELSFLNGREKLKTYPIKSLITY
ncbi:MAG: adenine phosphoribosyltransferase [Planctomycetota bacterium]